MTKPNAGADDSRADADPANAKASGTDGSSECSDRDALRRGGVIIIDKPAGPTSAQVVARVKHILKVRRVGHTGTLDPMATGVLPLCLGPATKIAGYLLADDKIYQGELMLGVETDTLDAEGTVTAENPSAAAAVDDAALGRCLAGFVGAGEQVPPMFSALKQRGRRLHELARAGQTVEREPRPITIYTLTLDVCALPRAQFTVHCSKGTYVRSLVADIGRALGCGAHLTALRRVRSGPFELARAVEFDRLTPESARAALVSTADALPHLPAVVVPPAQVSAIATGVPIPWAGLAGDGDLGSAAAIKLVTEKGQLLALAAAPDTTSSTPARVRYLRVMSSGLTSPSGSSNLPGSNGRGRSRRRR